MRSDATQAPLARDDENAINDDSSKTSWARLGQSLGKKAVVTGAVIVAAPVVLPPLVVLSSVALTLAFPSALYLASVAGTEKLMSALLPPLEVDGVDEDGLAEDEDLEKSEDGVEIPVEDGYSSSTEDECQPLQVSREGERTAQSANKESEIEEITETNGEPRKHRASHAANTGKSDSKTKKKQEEAQVIAALQVNFQVL